MHSQDPLSAAARQCAQSGQRCGRGFPGRHARCFDVTGREAGARGAAPRCQGHVRCCTAVFSQAFSPEKRTEVLKGATTLTTPSYWLRETGLRSRGGLQVSGAGYSDKSILLRQRRLRR